jgi:competence protein ComEC
MFVGRETYNFDTSWVYGTCAALCLCTLYLILRQGRTLWDGAPMRVFTWGALFLLGGSIMSPRWAEVNIPSDTVQTERAGIILSSPVAKPKTYMVRVLVGEPTRRGGVRNRVCMLYLQRDSTATSAPWTAGDTIRFCAKLESPGDTAFFGGVDYGKYLQVQHIDGVGYVPSSYIAQTSRKEGVPSLGLRDRLSIVSEHCKQSILRHIRPLPLTRDEYALVAAMTLGEKSFLSRATKEEYSATGASHILALSGMHLSILIMLIKYLLPRKWRLGRRSRYLGDTLLIAFTVGYVLLTGAPLSLQRAAGMLILSTLLLPPFSMRPKADSLNTLFLTTFLILCIDPLSLFDVGFQLSVSAILGILLFSPFFTLTIKKHPWVRKVSAIPATCIAAQLATGPLVAYYFHTFPTYFLVTGLWIAVLSITLLPTLWSLILSAGVPWVSCGVLWVFRTTLQIHNAILHTIAQWPHAILPAEVKNGGELVGIYTLMVCLYLFFRSLSARRARRKQASEK